MQLRHARARKLLSVRALAKRSVVASATVYNIEHGRTTPSFRAIRDISAALEMDPLDIDEFAAVIVGTGAGKATSVDRSRGRLSTRALHPAESTASEAQER